MVLRGSRRNNILGEKSAKPTKSLATLDPCHTKYSQNSLAIYQHKWHQKFYFGANT